MSVRNVGVCLIMPFVLCQFACSPAAPRPERQDDFGRAITGAVDQMRSIVLSKLPDLPADGRQQVSENDPQISHYKIAGSYGQFFYSWDVSSGRKIVAGYTGDIRHIALEDVRVDLKPE